MQTNKKVSETVVQVESLQTTFPTKQGNVVAVNNVSYSIKRGQTLGIVGESGCGKSVTSYSIMRLLEPPGKVTNGKVLVNGRDVMKLSETEMEEVRGKNIAMIFQEPMTALNPVLSIGYQLDEQIKKHLKLSPNDSRSRSIEMLELVGIPAAKERYRDYPHQLSGGMRQRAMIAMALSCDPDFLIADEPTTALDVTVQAQILKLIQDIQERMNMTVQFITHDMGVISELADEVMVMYAGTTCEQAPSVELFSKPRHPYTAALLESIPRFGSNVSRLPTIEGSVPSPINLPKGCPFQNRCKHVHPRCTMSKPPLLEISPGHKVACFLETS